VNARADNNSSTSNHCWGIVENPRYDNGLIGPTSVNPNVKAHFGKTIDLDESKSKEYKLKMEFLLQQTCKLEQGWIP